MHPTRSPLRGYAAAIVSIALATLARMVLDPVLGDNQPFLLFVPAVIFVAWYGGLGPALVTIALGSVAAAWFFVPPGDSLAIRREADRLALAVYILVGLTSALFSEAQGRAQSRAEVARQAAERATERTASLQALTAALAQSLTRGEVADVVVAQGVAALGAVAGVVGLLDEESAALSMVRAIGYPPELFGQWRVPLSAHAIDSDAARSGQPIWIESREELVARYPLLEAVPLTESQAFVTIPLVVEGRAIGVMGLSFAQPRQFTDSDRAFILALTRQCAQALERARLSEAERAARAGAEEARRRLAFLAEASAVLGSSLDYERTLQSVAELALPHIADGCVVDMAIEDGQLRRVAVAHPDPEGVRLVWEVDRRSPINPNAAHGPARVVRTGEPELLAEISDEMLVSSARDTEHLRLLRELDLKSHLIVPLISHGRVLGAITFVYRESGRRYGPDDLPVAMEVARRAAVAIDNARLYRETQAARVASESERARLQQVVDQLPEGVLIVDATRRFVMGNAVAAAIFGRALVGQLLSTSDAEADQAFGARRLDGSPIPAGELPLQRALRDGEVVQGEQILVRNSADGRDIPLLVNSAPLRDATGAITGGVIAFQDISAIKDFERARDEFLSALSHDLRTPITTIRGMAQVLLRRVSRMDTPEAGRLAEGLTNIEAATTKMTAMISELLDMARLEAGRSLDLQQVPVDMVALARHSADEHQRTATGHDIRVEAAEPSLVGMWDPVRLERVIGNLLSNAIKYSPLGGKVTVSVAPDKDSARSWCVLGVHDEGIGIPACDVPHIFERFRRGTNVVGRIEGTGIGLAGARQIVEQHGGTITAESKEGAGTTITVRLPLR
jgi:K+-sensing histidine kinase KdpD